MFKTRIHRTSLLAAVFVVAGLSACETVDGAGQDVSKAGQLISETARDVQADQ